MNKSFHTLTAIALVGVMLSACDSGTEAPKSASTSTSATSAAATPEPTSSATAIARPRRSIEAFGQIAPIQSVELSFTTSGAVAEVFVQEGDSVKAGDLIARLRNDSLQADVAQAEAGLDAAQARVDALPQAIAEAEAKLKAAKARIADLQARRSPNSAVLAAEAELAEAESRKQNAQTRYDRVLGRGQLGETEESARRELEEAIKKVEVARARLAELQPGSLTDLAEVAEIVAANAECKAAEARLNQLLAEQKGEIVGAAAAEVKRAESVLQTKRAALDQTILRAPFAGTVARLDMIAGRQVIEGRTVATLADFSEWRIEAASLLENDVTNIQIGQAVTIQIDALPGSALTGEVESISLVSQNENSRVIYPVTIKLTTVDPGLRWGMTALVKFSN